MARFSLVAAAARVLLLHGLPQAALGAPGRSCDRKFECTAFVTEDPRLLGRPGSGRHCDYGHGPADDACDMPSCNGVTRKACRCLTQTEAEDGVKASAKQNLTISAIIAGLGCVGCMMAWRQWQRRQQAQARREEEESGDCGFRSRSDLTPTENDNSQAVPATVVGSADAQPAAATGESTSESQPVVLVTVVDAGPAPAGDDATSPQIVRSGSGTSGGPLRQASSKMIQDNPKKFNMFVFILPVAVLGMLGFGAFKALSTDEPFYHSYSSFLLVVTPVVFICAMASATVLLFLKSNGNLGINRLPITFLSAFSKLLCPLTGFVGLAGAGWCFYRMNNPGGVYHDACMP